MSLSTREFPYCCTGTVLVDFGESSMSQGYRGGVDKAEMKAEIQAKIDQHRDYGFAFLSATTNDEQTTANEVLEELGFKSTEWMGKPIHRKTKVRLWWLELHPDFVSIN